MLTIAQRRRGLIIKRLRELEEANRDRTLYLTEVCKTIGVSQRTQTDICQDVLGVSPKRYLYLRRLHLVHAEAEAGQLAGKAHQAAGCAHHAHEAAAEAAA